MNCTCPSIFCRAHGKEPGNPCHCSQCRPREWRRDEKGRLWFVGSKPKRAPRSPSSGTEGGTK